VRHCTFSGAPIAWTGVSSSCGWQARRTGLWLHCRESEGGAAIEDELERFEMGSDWPLVVRGLVK